MRVIVTLPNGKTEAVKDYETNAADLDMKKPGEKTLEVTYNYDGTEYTKNVKITVVEEDYR